MELDSDGALDSNTVLGTKVLHAELGRKLETSEAGYFRPCTRFLFCLIFFIFGECLLIFSYVCMHVFLPCNHESEGLRIAPMPWASFLTRISMTKSQAFSAHIPRRFRAAGFFSHQYSQSFLTTLIRSSTITSTTTVEFVNFRRRPKPDVHINQREPVAHHMPLETVGR